MAYAVETNATIFAQAMLAHPRTIMGSALEPFSCWHMMLLCQADSPFVRPARADGTRHAATLEDVVYCVWVCSQTYQPHGLYLDADAIAKQAHAWGAEQGDWDLGTVCEQLSDYIDSYSLLPEFKTSGTDNTRLSPIPIWFRLPALILSHFPSCGESAAWNMPFGRAAAYRALIAEENMQELSDDMNRLIKAYARGKLTDEEYAAHLAVMRGDAPPPPAEDSADG